MEELWKQLPVAGPVGIALVIVVLLFLRHLNVRDERDRQERAALGERIDRLVDNHLERSRLTMGQVAAAIKEQGHQCEQMRNFVRDVAHGTAGK